MTSIAKEVWSAIEEDEVVRRALEKNIISLKNLSLYITKKKKLSASSHAIISAIRRYKQETSLNKNFENARKVIAKSQDIRITTKIVEVALEKHKQTQDLVQKAFNLVDIDRGETLLLIQGEQSIKLITNDKNKKKILALFPKKYIIKVEEDLAEINIQLHEDATSTPGIVSTLTTELMIHDIAIFETMSCVPEMLFFVKQKDVVRSYDILFKLCGLDKS